MEDIKFTVHIPVYNTAKYIKRCMDSILTQSYNNFEIILTDDGSTDNSGELCDEYAAKDPRIKVFHNKNHGILPTRRFSIARGHGDYSLFVDSDDYVEPDYFSTIYSMLTQHNCDLLIFNYNLVVNEKKKENISVWDKDMVFSGNREKSSLYKIFFETRRLNSLWSKVIKTELLLRDRIEYKNYGDVNTGEDFLQSIEPILNAEKIVYSPKPLYDYVYNNTSITNSCNTNKVFSILKARECGYRYLADIFTDIKGVYAEYASLDYLQVIEHVIEIAKSGEIYPFKKDVYNRIKENDYYNSFVKKYAGKGLLSGKLKLVSFFFDKCMYPLLELVKFYRQ